MVHHGGAGTTEAGLRAGKPSVICPFVGDQPFGERRVATLGACPVPIPQGKLTAERPTARIAASDSGLRQRSAALGEVICSEDGIGQAVEIINRRLSDRQIICLPPQIFQARIDRLRCKPP